MNSHEEFIVCWDHLLCFSCVVEVDSSNSAICIHFKTDAFDEIGPESLITVLLQIKNNFVPAFIEFQWHGTLEGFDSGDGLIVAGDECSFNILVVENCDLESEILLKLLYDSFTFFTNKTKIGIFIFKLAFGLFGMVR